MKKLITLVLAIAMIFTCCAALAETEKPLAGQTLTIALSPDFMYFETISETEECGYEGLDIDIIKSLSETLGFEFEIVPMSFSSLIGTLQTGNADFVISGMSYTDERAEVVDFSIPYATTKIGIVTKIGSEIDTYEELEGEVICCSQGTNYENLIQTIPGATLKTYQGQAAVGAAVAEGSDGVTVGLTSINGCKKLANTVMDSDGNPMLQYCAIDNDTMTNDFNIAFPKGSELVEIFNAALQDMKDSGELEEMIQYWLY